MEEEDELNTSFVPPGLASFVAKAQATLQEAQRGVLQQESPAKSASTNVSTDMETSFQIQEDDEDRRLKQQVMDKFNKTTTRNDTPQTDSKAGSILETANLLLGLEDDEPLEEEGLLFPNHASPPAKATTPMSPQGEGIEFTQSDLLSPVSDATSTPPDKILASRASDEVVSGANATSTKGVTTNHAAKTVSSTTTETADVDLLGMEASPVKPTSSPMVEAVGTEVDLLGMVDSSSPHAKMPMSPEGEGIEFSASDLLSAPSSEVISPDKPSEPVSLEVKEEKTLEKGDVAASETEIVAAASPKEGIEVDLFSPPPPPPNNNNNLAMSVAPEVTSPLESAGSNHVLSASTPELSSKSPWRQALQSMVARLDSAQSSSSSADESKNASPPLAVQPPPNTTEQAKPSPSAVSPPPPQQSVSPSPKEKADAVSSPPAVEPPESEAKHSPAIKSPKDVRSPQAPTDTVPSVSSPAVAHPPTPVSTKAKPSPAKKPGQPETGPPAAQPPTTVSKDMKPSPAKPSMSPLSSQAVTSPKEEASAVKSVSPPPAAQPPTPATKDVIPSPAVKKSKVSPTPRSLPRESPGKVASPHAARPPKPGSTEVKSSSPGPKQESPSAAQSTPKPSQTPPRAAPVSSGEKQCEPLVTESSGDPDAAEKPKTEAPSTKTQPVSAEDDSFLPNRRMETPKTKRPVQVSKSEVSKRVTKPSSKVTDRSKLRKSMPATKKGLDRPRMPSTSTRTTVTTSTAGSSLTATSRLYQGTASTQARQKRASPPTRPVGKNAVTTRLSKQASPPSSAVSSKSTPDDGVAKAKERVRQLKLAEAKKAKQSQTAQVKKPETRSSTRGSAMSAEEGRKIAQERVRRQRQQLQAKTQAASVKGKENRGRLPNQTTESGVSKRVERASASNRAGTSSAASQRRTIPKSPQLATKAVLGEKSRGARIRGSVSKNLNPNPITRALGSPTHGDVNKVTKGSGSARSRLTVPKGPRLSTAAKYGDKRPPSLREKKVEPAPAPASPKKRPARVTQPVPFHFHSSKASSTPAPTGAKRSELSMAERMEMFSRKGLRDEAALTATATKKFKPTIPKSPKFSSIAQRALPKSAEEMEEEMMEYYKAHPFKARPVGTVDVYTGPATQVPKRRLTQPVPFHFHADERAKHSKPPAGSPDPESKDLEECKKQFHARPMPRFSSHKAPSRNDAAAPHLTTPKPFHLTSSRDVNKSSPHGPTPDEVELSKQFHARPVPQSTYTAPAPKTRRHSAAPSAVATPRHAGPPKLATLARTEPREAARLASQRNAELKARQREQMLLRKKREKHEADMAKAMSPPLGPITPFRLQSEARHEAYQHDFAEQLAQEEAEKKRQLLFRARPLRISDPPPPIHSDRPATTPEPFPLQSVTRHQQWEEERRRQLQEEELERQRQMTVKATPVPKSTYEYSPVTPASKKKRKQVEAEETDLDSARKRAMEALKIAESEMPESEVPPADGEAGHPSVQGRSFLGGLMGNA